MQLSQVTSFIRPHMLTTNIYVQQSILKENVAIIKQGLLNAKTLRLSYFDIIELRKMERHQSLMLRQINENIFDIEQGSFPFGSPSS